MDLATIEMPQQEARKAFLDYRRALKERHNAEDEALMRGYRWLAGGKDGETRRLLHLTETITAGGADDRGLPRLAVMRATRPWCRVATTRRGDVTYCGDNDFWRARHRDRLQFSGVIPAGLPVIDPYHHGWTALVPIIPPALRPKRGLQNFHVLWEAEWFQQRPVAPHDPALLRHLMGDLWAVVAVWDLTELERAVLTHRA